MSDKVEPEDFLPVEDMRGWQRQEIKNITKECELRILEVSSLVTAYAAGEISPKEAAKRLGQYDDRWGESLGGATAGDHLTNEQIYAQMDRLRKFVRTKKWENDKNRSGNQR